MARSKLCVLTVPTHRRLCPGRGPPGRDARAITQREEQCCRCSLIYKLPVLWMPGASARYSCLRTPVETSTSPCVRMDPIGQVSARGAKTTTGESILPSKIEPASLGFDFEKRTTLQASILKKEQRYRFSSRKRKASFRFRKEQWSYFFLPKSNPLRWASILKKEQRYRFSSRKRWKRYFLTRC